MATDLQSLLAEIRSGIEQRVNEQIERHRRADPNGDSRQVVDIQIKQEREKLERLLENEESPAMAGLLQTLMDDYLPWLAKQLKGR